jgi:YHS domain-containing protein
MVTASAAKGIANPLTRPRLIRLGVIALTVLLLVGGVWFGWRWWSGSSAADILSAERGPATPIGIALDGHCPVTLSTEMRWAPGHVAWNAVYDGQLYLFASQRHQEVFLINPAAYGPAIAGIDAIELAEHGRATRGHRMYGVNHGGRVYLFASEGNLARFAQAPDQYLTALKSARPVEQTPALATRVNLGPVLR